MIHRRLPAAALLALLYLAPPPFTALAFAQVMDVFEVKGVAVDVTADTAAQAKDHALAQGQITAFKRLLERLVVRSNYRYLPDFANNEINGYIKDFSVTEEKTSPVRYLAKLDFRFKGQEVRRMLTNYAVSFAETYSKPVLVLPVFETAGTKLLFDDPNPWRDAWVSRPARDSLVPAVLPVGDLQDIAAIGAEQALGGDRQRLDDIVKRYGAGDALVAHASQRLDEFGRPVLEVFVSRYGMVVDVNAVSEVFFSVSGESYNDLMRRAALELTLRIEDKWKMDNLLQVSRRSIVAATLRISELKDWLKMQKQMDGVAVINKVELVLLSRDEARINIHYIGEPEQLILALEQKDISLSREGDEWLLSPAAKPR